MRSFFKIIEPFSYKWITEKAVDVDRKAVFIYVFLNKYHYYTIIKIKLT